MTEVLYKLRGSMNEGCCVREEDGKEMMHFMVSEEVG